jgi:hypothetical protein
VLAAVELVFLASAFRGGGAGRPLVTEVLLVVDPARGMRRERQAMAERFRAAPFPLYGLPASFTGLRHLGGSGGWRTRPPPGGTRDRGNGRGEAGPTAHPRRPRQNRVGVLGSMPRRAS